MDISTYIIYLSVCIVLIAFFAGTEIAFISASKLGIELKKKQGKFSGKIIAGLMENPSEFIGTSLVGINIVLVIYGTLAGNLTEIILKNNNIILAEYPKLIIDTILATIFVLFFAEFLPKAIFRANADYCINIFSIPMYMSYHLLKGISRIFVNISEFILKYFFNIKIKENKQVFNRIDLEHFVKQNLQGQDKENTNVNTELFENALYLANVKIRKCMIPRNEIEAIDLDTPIAEVKRKFISTKLSKILVYENSIDNIIGYVHHLDLNRRPDRVKDILHNILAVPEAMSAVDLMNKFTKERKSIAWVVDEFGGTAGIVTMEDVLEEIFGEIKDEYDVEEYVDKQISDNEYLLSGRLELDHLNQKYDLDLPIDGAETLSGYIIEKHDAIPKMNDIILLDRYEFHILLVSNTRIETVKMIVHK